MAARAAQALLAAADLAHHATLLPALRVIMHRTAVTASHAMIVAPMFNAKAIHTTVLARMHPLTPATSMATAQVVNVISMLATAHVHMPEPVVNVAVSAQVQADALEQALAAHVAPAPAFRKAATVTVTAIANI
jgi:hypothetical protein